jgi:hypothetical protein
MTECMFHSGDDCPAARELADLDRQIDLRMKAEAENKRLMYEVQALRLYGNKDCTALADEAISSAALGKE